MTTVPACCEARYEAVDELVSEMRQRASAASAASAAPPGGDVANLLMVKVWDYLKGEPHADIETMLRAQLMRRESSEMGCCLGRVLPPAADSHIIDDARSDLNHRLQNVCRETCKLAGDQATIQLRYETSPVLAPGLSQTSSRSQRPGKSQSKNLSRHGTGQASGAEPITNALKNIKEAQKYDSNCAWKLHDLLTAEERIAAHVKRLEARELQGIEQLQQADAMWTAMEELYKKKIREVEAHHATMLTEENDIRNSLVKWRTQNQKNIADMEELRASTIDYEERAKEKQREEACNIQDAEAMKKQMETVKKEIETVRVEIERIKKVSQSTKVDMESQILKLEKEVSGEKTRRMTLVEEGRESTARARDNLATACRVLLQLRLEVEERRTEEETVNTDIDVMKESMDACSDKCRAKVKLIRDEIDVVDQKMASYRQRCEQCHQSCSTSDVRKLCSDCPRCQREVECLYADPTHCGADAALTCVCHLVKEKLVENILENMYNVLEANVKKTGDTLADELLESLDKSTNGKLTEATRDRLHEYVKRTIEDNLDMCIMGGAMKTRCEMDPEIRKQLDLCLKEIEETALPKDDNGDCGSSGKDFDKKDKDKPDVRKRDLDKEEATAPSCRRWGGARACHCPRGPDECECARAPPAAPAPRPCGLRHVTTKMSKSSMVSRDAPTSCTCGVPATCNDTPLACYCGRAGAGASRRPAGLGGSVCGGGGLSRPPAGSACKHHCPESGGNTPKKVSLTGFNAVKGGARTPRKHDSPHKTSPYLSTTSSKRSASSARKSPKSRSETSIISSASSMEARDPHGFFCNFLSHISKSLHSFFHPPRFSENSERRGDKQDAALKMGSLPSNRSKPSTPTTAVRVVLAANKSLLPTKVVPSALKVEPELKVDPSPVPYDDHPTRYSRKQNNYLDSPVLKGLESTIFIHKKRERSSTLLTTKSSRIKSLESTIGGSDLSSTHPSSMKGFCGSKESVGSKVIVLLPNDRKVYDVASKSSVEVNRRPEVIKNLSPQKKSKHEKGNAQICSTKDSTQKDECNNKQETKFETINKPLEKERSWCMEDSSGFDKSENNLDIASEIKLELELDIESVLKSVDKITPNVCVDDISKEPKSDLKNPIIVNNTLEKSINGSMIYREPKNDAGRNTNKNLILIKNQVGSIDKYNENNVYMRHKSLGKSSDKKIKKINCRHQRNNIENVFISRMKQESYVDKRENYKCNNKINAYGHTEKFKDEVAWLSALEEETHVVSLNVPGASTSCQVQNNKNNANNTELSPFLSRFYPNIELQLPRFMNNHQFMTSR